MVAKWLSSFFGNKVDLATPASNSNNKGRGEALEDLALIYEAREDWQKAFETWGQVLAQKPQRIRAFLGQGHAFTKLNLPERALAQYLKAAKFDRVDKNVSENAPREDAAREKAIWAFRRHLWGEAFASWNDILERYPRSLEAALHLGQCLVELGETFQARSIYADLVEMFPHRSGPWQGLLRIGLHERDWLLCDVARDKCIALGADSIEVLNQCLDYHIARKQFDAAHDLIATRFQQFEPIESIIGQINIELARGDLAHSLQLIAEGERQFPERARQFRNKRSDCMARMGRFEDAFKVLEDNFEQMQAGVPATARFITACIEAGRFKKASRMINALPEEWHCDRTLSAAIAWNFVKQGEPSHARQAWDRVPFRPKLQRQKDMQVRVDRVRWPSTVTGQTRIRLYCVLDKASPELPAFLDYYRAIGVEEFFLIDDGASGEMRDLILSQPDCVLFQSTDHNHDHSFGAYWINFLRHAHEHEGWDLFVRQDTLLTLPDLETLGLAPHLDLMEARSEEILSAVCLFAYGTAQGTLFGGVAHADSIGDPTYLDTRLRLHQTLYSPYLANFEQYGKKITDPMDVQHVCAPIIRADADIRYLSGNHLTTPGAVSLLRGAILAGQVLGTSGGQAKEGEIQMDQAGFVRYEGPDHLERLGILNRVSS